MQVRQKYDSPLVVPPGSSGSKSSAHQANADMKRDLNICISVLNELKSQLLAADSSFYTDSDIDALRNDLCLPVQTEDRTQLKLAPLTQCTYCDEEWLRQGPNPSPIRVIITVLICTRIAQKL